jgi:hypothetical protein
MLFTFYQLKPFLADGETHAAEALLIGKARQKAR